MGITNSNSSDHHLSSTIMADNEECSGEYGKTIQTVAPHEEEPPVEQQHGVRATEVMVSAVTKPEADLADGVVARTSKKSSAVVVYRFKVDNVYCASERPEGIFVSLSADAGLYDLIDEVFRALLTPLCGDDIISHLWSLSLERGETFHGPFHHEQPECSARVPRKLGNLAQIVGDKGRFQGESGVFTITLEEICTVETSTSKVLLPFVKRFAPPQWSTDIIPDFVTAKEMARVMGYRDAFDKYMTGDNAWVRCRKSNTFIVGKPKSLDWGYASNPEVHLLILLLKSGAKFKQSWESILKYGLPRRTKGATSMKWYQLRNQDYVTDSIARGKSSSEMILCAKRIARTLMDATLARDIPSLGPKPLTGYEQECLECFDRMSEDNRKSFLRDKPWLRDVAMNKKARIELLGNNSDY